jgi:aquaporin Z
MSGSMKRYLAELIGTAILVLVGCGAVAIGGYVGALPLGVVPIGLAFGLAVTAMAYGIGPVSGCHINPAVTVAMVMAGRMEPGEATGYIVSQLVGGVVGALILVLILSGHEGGYDIAKLGLGQNGYDAASPGHYSLLVGILTEIVATLVFTIVILGVTQPSASEAKHPAGLVIGLTLFALHMPFIQVTGLSVNPARSLGPAVFVGGTALVQVWMFLIMPLIGGALAGWLFRARILSAQ